MKTFALVGWLVVLVAVLPASANAVGSMQPQRNKDFRELIVKGERPEIAACLVAAIDYSRHAPGISAIRWNDDTSDKALMRESESNGRLTRFIRLTTQMRTKRWIVFAESWRTVEVSCEQTEDGTVRLSVRPISH